MTRPKPPGRIWRTITAVVEIPEDLTEEEALTHLRTLLPAARLFLSDMQASMGPGHATSNVVVTQDVRSALWTAPALALTPRQRDIVHLIKQGLTNKQIALSLGISHFTVRNHISHIMGMLGVHRRTNIIESIRARGWPIDQILSL